MWGHIGEVEGYDVLLGHLETVNATSTLTSIFHWI